MTAQGAEYTGAQWRPPPLSPLPHKAKPILTHKFPKSEKNRYGDNTNLISFKKWLFHYILCPFLYGIELQLGGAIEISPRALVVLKPPLHPVEVVCRLCSKPPVIQSLLPSKLETMLQICIYPNSYNTGWQLIP